MLKEGQAFIGSFSKLRTWLHDHYAERARKLFVAHFSSRMSTKMSSSESFEEIVSRVAECLAVSEAAAFKIDMAVVVRTIVSGLHLHFLPMASPMLYAGTVATIPVLCDGLKVLTIIGKSHRAGLEFGNAASQPPVSDDTYKYRWCHQWGVAKHIACKCSNPTGGN